MKLLLDQGLLRSEALTELLLNVINECQEGLEFVAYHYYLRFDRDSAC